MLKFAKPYFSKSTSTSKPYFKVDNDLGSGSNPVIVSLMKKIQKELLDGINFDDINQYTIDLLRTADRLEKLDSNYLNNYTYLQIYGLLEQLDNNNRLILLKNEIDRLEDENTNLKEQLDECERKDKHKFIDQSIGLNIDTELKIEYLRYVIDYGMPEDGIFDPSKLNKIRMDLGFL
jgi:hypothetical protein